MSTFTQRLGGPRPCSPQQQVEVLLFIIFEGEDKVAQCGIQGVVVEVFLPAARGAPMGPHTQGTHSPTSGPLTPMVTYTTGPPVSPSHDLQYRPMSTCLWATHS